MQPLTTSSLPPLRRRIDPSSTETAPKETGPAVVSANSIISGEMPIVRVSSPISQTPSAHPETIESQIVAYLCLPKIQFSLSRLNLNDGSYSLRMQCSRSSSRCSIRFGSTRSPEVAHQLLEAFPWDSAPHYLLRDRDGSYGGKFSEATSWLGIVKFSRHRNLPGRTPTLSD